MEPLFNLLPRSIKKAAKPVRSTERGDLLQYFLDTINSERRADKRKSLPFMVIAVKCTGLELKDLYYLKSICEDADRRGGWKDKDGNWHPTSFGKVFFGSLKSREPKK